MITIKKLLYISMGALMLSSCAKDYLETQPSDEISQKTVFESTANAALAINGLAKMMTTQYMSSGFNGEGTIKMYYGNYMGNHFFLNNGGASSFINGGSFQNTTSIYDYYPWYYYYKIITNANSIIVHIDEASGSEQEKEFIKAQALTFRAYSFSMLAQLYAFRWSDSNNGTSLGLALRLDESNTQIPLSTLAETYQQIYSDLDNAISLYKKAGLTRKNNYSPDINVAYATYARAALNKQDYATAESAAINARTGYPLMTNAEYQQGFSTPNKEWIWSSFGSGDETLYFYSYFAQIGYNSSASNVRTTPKCMSKELYNEIPATDIRKALFLDPTGYSYNIGSGVAGEDLNNEARRLFPDIQNNATVYAYMQFKMKAQEQPGVGHLNHFRSAEMYLIEAEAKYFQNKPANDIQSLLVELNKTSGRDVNYTCTKTGVDLLNEIKKYRAIELWGEGFDWFDLKRWSDPIKRTSTNNGGNFIPVFAVTIQPGSNNKWTWKIPIRETDYNKAIQ